MEIRDLKEGFGEMNGFQVSERDIVVVVVWRKIKKGGRRSIQRNEMEK